MSSTDTPVGAASSILTAVQAQTLAVEAFKNEQVAVYTSHEATVTVTDADGNTVTVPSWYAINAAITALTATVTNGGGGGAQSAVGQTFTFDAAASQVAVPLSFLPTSSFAGIEYLSSSLDVTGKIVSLSSPDANTTAQTSITGNGFFPVTGKYWMIVQIASVTTDPTNVYNTLSLALVSTQANQMSVGQSTVYLPEQIANIGYVSQGGLGAIISTYLQNGTQSAQAEALVAAGTQALLITFDIDNSIIEVYDTTGVIATLTPTNPPTNWGSTIFSDVSIGAIDNALTLTFNTNDPTKSPYAIPNGFNPLTLSTAVAPSGAVQGSYIQSTTYSILNGMPVNPGSTYVFTPGTLYPLLDDGDLTNFLASGGILGLNVAGMAFLKDAQNNQFIGCKNSLNTPSPSSCYNNLVIGGDPTINGANNASNIVIGLDYFPNGTGSNVCIGDSTPSGYGLNASVLIGSAFGNAISNPSVPSDVTHYPNYIQSVVIGTYAMNNVNMAINTDGSGNQSVIAGSDVVIGASALFQAVLNGNQNVLVGAQAGYKSHLASNNTSVGFESFYNVNDSYGNHTALGSACFQYVNMTTNTSNATSGGNVAIGNGVCTGNSSNPLTLGSGNVFIGDAAGSAVGGVVAIGDSNIGIGTNTLAGASVGHDNIAMGQGANQFNTTYPNGALIESIAIGASSSAGPQSVALGYQADANFTNSVSIGAGSNAGGDNEVQLGNSSTTVYAYGAVQNRSDARDKTDVRPTVLGLDFIKSIRPVDFRWDMREDYIDRASMPVAPAPLPEKPSPPTVSQDDPTYVGAMAQYHASHAQWLVVKMNYDARVATYTTALAAWKSQNNLATIVPNGSKKRARYHHGVIAQEVKTVADKMNVDFGGFQDHTVNGGADVKSVGYEEFIGPIIKAIQEVDAKVTSADHITQVADQVMTRLMNNPAFIQQVAHAMSSATPSP